MKLQPNKIKMTTFFKLTEDEIMDKENVVKLNLAGEKIELLEQQIEQLKAQNKLYEEENKRLRQSDDSKADKEQLQKLQSKLNSLEKESADNKKQIKSLEEQNKKLKSENTKIDNEQLQQLQNKLTTLEKQLDKIEEALSSDVSDEMFDLSYKFDKMKNDISALSKKVDDQSDKTEKLLKGKENKKIEFDLDFIFVIYFLISIIFVLAASGLLIYFQTIGVNLLNLWPEALILLGLCALPILVYTIFLGVEEDDFLLFAIFFIISIAIAAVLIVLLNLLGAGVIYLVHLF